MDLRERDLVYERGRPDPYRRPPARAYHSPSPSPDRVRYERRVPRFHDDFDSDDGRSARRPYYPDERRFSRPPHRSPSPDYEPRRFVDREREREYVRERSPSPPPRRPAPLRRQSSLDTFDRPRGNDLGFLERDPYDRHRGGGLSFLDREEYGPPARREDVRASYGHAPIPRSRSRATRPLEFDDESFRGGHVLDHDRLQERELVRVGHRGSRASRSRTSMSRTRSESSGSSTSRETSPSRATTVRSDYPKRGKTRIPGKLVSKRALIDMGYPFMDEGKTVIILKALGQDQIDQVLRVSEEYKKAELEVSAARSSAGAIEDRHEEFHIPPPAPPPVVAPEVEVKEAVVREPSPSSRTYTTSYPTSYPASTTTGYTHGPLVMRPRSRSRSGREIRAEMRALEAELREAKGHRKRSGSVGGDLVRVEKAGDGQQIVLVDEKVEKVDEGYRGPRIERDKRGPPPALMRAMLKTIT